MPYCHKCGAELSEDAKFCPSCGTSVTEPEIVVERKEGRSTGVRVVLLIFGSIILLVSLGLLVGGGVLLGLNTVMTDSEGFLSTGNRQLKVDSYAMVFQHIDINLGDGWWRPSPGDFVTIKLSGSNNDPTKNVFIGIAEESDVNAYLSGVEYDELTNFGMRGDPFQGFDFDVTYVTHPGGALNETPTSKTFWTASAYGAGTQNLEWAPETGRYWIVLMNEDGSASVDLTVGFGARIPLLSTIAVALLAAGIVALIIAGVMIYFGIRR